MCMKLEEIEHFLEGRTIEKFVEEIDWKEFENFVKEIFSANGFKSIATFRFKNDKRFEIDIVAVENNLIFAIDCKEWDKGRHKSSGIKRAAEDQIRRIKEFERFLKNNPIAQTKLKVNSNAKIIPILVTWYDEMIDRHENCYVIPIWKLNSFLNSHDFY